MAGPMPLHRRPAPASPGFATGGGCPSLKDCIPRFTLLRGGWVGSQVLRGSTVPPRFKLYKQLSGWRRAAGLVRGWIFLTICAALPINGLVFAQSAAISPADRQAFQEAMEAVNGGDAAKARPLLEGLHARHPHNFQIDESLGLLYAAGNDLQKAAPLLEAAVEEKRDSDAARANLGIAYLKLGRNSDAVRELEFAAKLNPANSTAEEALGQAWMQLSQPGKAAAAFQAALAVDGNNPTLLYNAALALFDSGDAAHAAPLLARMPGVASSSEAQSLYADVDEKLGEYRDAAQHYLNAFHLSPTETNQYLLGVELLRHWTFEPAMEEFASGARRFPASRRMRLGLGIAYFGGGKYSQAIAVFSDLLAADPNNATYADLLGRSCAVLAEGVDPKCAALLSYASRHPRDGMIATDAAITILRQPDGAANLEEARRLLEAAIRATPDQPEPRYELGLLLQRQSQWRASIPELKIAIRLKPDYSAAHYRLALAYSHTGRREEAQTEIALQRKYSAQESQDRNARLIQMKTLLVTMK